MSDRAYLIAIPRAVDTLHKVSTKMIICQYKFYVNDSSESPINNI